MSLWSRKATPNMMETYHGHVRTPADAIKLFEACRLGMLPRVQRRLSEKERQSIRSGSVFVWDEKEAGMRRWTDGKSWSASRVSGSFLTYREMEGKRGSGFNVVRRGAGKTPDSGRGSDEDQDDGEPDGYRYKVDGLMKQSFSITTSTGQHLHLISYYRATDARRAGSDAANPGPKPAWRCSHERHVSRVEHERVPGAGHDARPDAAATSAGIVPCAATPTPSSSPGVPATVRAANGLHMAPSPVATPPYSTPSYSHGPYAVAPPYPQNQLPPPPPQPQPQPPQHYPPAASVRLVDTPELRPTPSPAPQSIPAVQPKPGQPPSPAICAVPSSVYGTAEASSLESPRSHHLQTQARDAAMIDPRLAAPNPRNHQGLLPIPTYSVHHDTSLGSGTPPPGLLCRRRAAHTPTSTATAVRLFRMGTRLAFPRFCSTRPLLTRNRAAPTPETTAPAARQEQPQGLLG